ncbi:MAG: ankyrin repeat domain-containing protein [Pseudomonadota bacterium]
MSKQLPPNASLRQLRLQARERRVSGMSLKAAYAAIAEEYGFDSWAALKHTVEAGPFEPWPVDDFVELWEAMMARDIDRVRRVLDKVPELVDSRSAADRRLKGDVYRAALQQDAIADQRGLNGQAFGDTPLHWMIFTGIQPPGDLEIAKLLVAHGADVNALDPNGDAPIYNATWEGGFEQMQLLLENGADVTGEQGVRAVRQAADHSTIDRYDLLADYGAPVTAFTHLSAGLVDRIPDLLLEQPTLLSETGEQGMTLLQTAATRAEYPGQSIEEARVLMRSLIAMGAEMDIHAAAALDDADTIRQISNPDIVNMLVGNWSALNFAACTGSHAAIRALLAAGANPNPSIKDGRSPLELACLNNDDRSVELLIEAGAFVTDAAVSDAAWGSQGHLCLQLLMDHGGNPNVVRNGVRPLSWVCAGGNLEAARVLLHAGADPNAKSLTMGGQRPLHAAGAFGNVPDDRIALIGLLVDAGADINGRNDNGETPLDLASNEGIIAAFEAHGAKRQG